ncbi:MAG: hypothetical protein UY17_C0017G0005 [Candidatus Beckwithbacteria bacterium GW2011_GWC2_47_9]|uniref:Uncharacterized protein n=1 Tax=Candidatus Beckwithbacteria bacterium GW2011_GWC2_47_9 TaxID=1618373 RepID=A0A0G1WAX3_9BACT|nr:MAG: hypothetical protein UY17_C0017G0005 [Candidatus Beckwithbacteria bacterium GW2011_GWC2_47_9]
MDKRTKFLKVYANLPLGERSEVVVVVDNEPLSWNAAHLEVEQNTPTGKKILEILTKLEILK